jgi:hypothetical protein
MAGCPSLLNEVMEMEKDEFVKDFNEFYAEVKNIGLRIPVNNIAMLYAIYRKDLRTDRVNSNGFFNGSHQKPTDKQRQYLQDLAQERGYLVTNEMLDKMTRDEVSQEITRILGGE